MGNTETNQPIQTKLQITRVGMDHRSLVPTRDKSKRLPLKVELLTESKTGETIRTSMKS